MTSIWKKPLTTKPAANSNPRKRVKVYNATGLGAPFEILLHDSVEQSLDPTTGEVLSTRIPSLGDLRKEIALARCLHPRKLAADELKFVRKAIGLKAIDQAALLGISAEHLSRCESGDRILSPAAEKLLRVIVLKKRHELVEIGDRLISQLDELSASKDQILKLRSILRDYRDRIADLERTIFNSSIDTVHSVDDHLSFSFEIRRIDDERNIVSDATDDGQWKRQVAEAA